VKTVVSAVNGKLTFWWHNHVLRQSDAAFLRLSAMSNPLSIQGALPFGGSHTASPSSPITPTPVASPSKPVPLFVNPSYQFDPTVGLVVLEFHNDTGAISNSIPTQRQLEMYRTHQAIPPNEQPPPTQAAAQPTLQAITRIQATAPVSTAAAIAQASAPLATSAPPVTPAPTSTPAPTPTPQTVNGTSAAG
jgi:hypothetical protein